MISMIFIFVPRAAVSAERIPEILDTEISIKDPKNPKPFDENKKVARQGGNVAKVARLELEAKTGKKVVTPLNAKVALKNKNKEELS